MSSSLMMTNNPVGLYVHVPFCKRKCPYCDFYSVKTDKNTEKQYIDALIRNFEKYKGTEIDTVYFGGGTPSVLTNESYYRILHAIYKNFELSKTCEITLEANPCSVTFNQLQFLKEFGFNRISFGVQSFIDTELHKLGRTHNADKAKEAVLMANKAGFDNISCDLMLGIIGQTEQSLAQSINELSMLPITHVSAYMLKIEPHTPYNNKIIINQLPNEDIVCDLYEQSIKSLESNGFIQYEISNFAKAGYESKHNLKYWQCEEYIGIGPSAHSFFNGKRYYVPSDINEFISSPIQNEIINEPHPHTFEEFAMLKLRLCEGLTFKEVKSFNIDLCKLLNKSEKLVQAGLVDIDENRIRITQKGFLVSNEIIVELVI